MGYVPFGGHLEGGQWKPGCEPFDEEILALVEEESRELGFEDEFKKWKEELETP